MTARPVHISENPAHTAAVRLCETLAEIGHATIAVSGGSTPKALFRLLAGEFRSRIHWPRIRIFQVDERCVPPDHADSNWRILKETLLDHAPGATAHRMPADEERGDEAYEALLLSKVRCNNEGVPVFDLVLLGMGADGHTASLFPGTAALRERERCVVFNDVPQLQTRRMTLTFPVLEAADRRWFLVQGAEKAEAFERVRGGELPAGQLVQCAWFIDPEAAGQQGD